MKTNLRLTALTMLFAMCAQSAHAQSGTRTPGIANPGDLMQAPNPITIPTDNITADSLSPSAQQGTLEPIDLGEVLEPTQNSGGFEQNLMNNDGYLLDTRSTMESTGTWLQRGYWFTEFDVLVLTREWDRDNARLGSEVAGNGFPLIPDALEVKTWNGAYANFRFTGGRFLFRDEENRDHFAEITYLSGDSEHQQGMATASAINSLASDQALESTHIGFSQNSSQSFVYDSIMDSLELNYHIKKRMERDQMVLMPEGNWVRRATPSKTREFIAGFRWFSIDEGLSWDAVGGNEGNMTVKVLNDLLGFQIGGGQHHETSRYSLGIRGKAGVYLSMADLHRNFLVTANGIELATDAVDLDKNSIAFVGEGSIIGKYHLRQNLSLRVSGELIYVDGVAVAPHQTHFTPQETNFSVNGGSFYLGFGLGIEGYW